MEKKGQIGTTLTIVFSMVLLVIFATFYIAGTLLLKITGEEVQKSIELSGDGAGDSVAMQNLIGLKKTGNLEDSEVLEKICPYYYLQTPEETEYFVNPGIQRYDEISLLLKNQLVREAELYYPSEGEIKKLTYRQELEC
jgi:hypothetical protein